MRRGAAYVGLIVVVLLSWQGLVVSGTVKPIVLPRLSAVATTLRQLIADPAATAKPIASTLEQAATAFAIAALVGITVGLVVGSSKLLVYAYEPLLASANALPLVVLYPVLAATLGVGGASKVVLGLLYGFFPVAISTARAAATVDVNLTTAASAMGASRGRVIRTVVLPAIAQPLFTGLRVGLGLTLVTVVAGEFIAGDAGLGYQLAASSQSLDTPGLFAWVIVTVTVTVIVNVLFNGVTLTLQKGFER